MRWAELSLAEAFQSETRPCLEEAPMEWIVVIAIGAIIGGVVSFVTLGGLKMPQTLTILLAIIGAIFGGLIAKVTGFLSFGQFTLYITAAGLSIALLAGGILAFSLTNEEKRV
jgi:ABC-type enterochelin transport system permease subunit